MVDSTGGSDDNKGKSLNHFTPYHKSKLEVEKDFVDLEKEGMLKIAATAMNELISLMSVDESLWMENPFNDLVGLILVRERYMDMFPRVRIPGTCDECTKDSQIVRIGGVKLVELILDSEGWGNLFPTIVVKAEIQKIIDAGSSENRSGALQTMYEEMHVLSPLVPPRQFYFLRYCRQIEDGLWVIADVSLHSFEGNIDHSSAHKLPSGCMIRELPNGSCMVTWIEHVLVHDTVQWVRLYGDLISDFYPYGARRWLLSLQSACEKKISASIEYIPRDPTDREIKSREGRKSLMDLSNRMVQSFCRVLKKSGLVNNNAGDEEIDSNHFINTVTHFTVRRNTREGQPDGMVLTAIASIKLPIPPQTVFHFLSDEEKRQQWDVLACGNPVREVTYISMGGTTAYNRVSIMKICSNPPQENDELILQESCIDPMGSYVVYAPIEATFLHRTVAGEDSSTVSILPSGFTITGDGLVNTDRHGVGRRSKGSLLTVAFQTLVCSGPTMSPLNMDSLASVKKLFLTTIEKIKAALGCSDSSDDED